MKKEHFSFLLGLFFFISSITFISGHKEVNLEHQQTSISAVWNNLAPTDLNSDHLKINQQLHLNWKSVSSFQSNNFLRAFHERNYHIKIYHHLFKQLLNDKVPISIWVQCFRN